MELKKYENLRDFGNFTIYYFKSEGEEEDDLGYGYLVYYGEEYKENVDVENVIAYLEELKRDGKIECYFVHSDCSFVAYIKS